ncbi:unnamed protein product [Mytilus edulis]|uniref:Uncharacterized protein n=1 Tax=Mytilus edulis TaxID=6550 RepID=A0A8S3SG48_MYTED|nr:unnamed protein product [Mytilus edulis]
MNSKLNTKTKLLNSCNNKRRRFKKPWWSNDLTSKWNETCSAENQYLRCTNNSNKSALRTLYLNKRKDFDKLVQQSKRCYWHQCQEDLLYMNNNDSKQFWRKIGNIGIGNERQSAIPNEVVLSDGSVTNNLDSVLHKWKDCFYNLLNQSNNSDPKIVKDDLNLENIIVSDLLDNEITFDEVHNIVMSSKNNKSPGVDLIQSELCKNFLVIC